MDKLTLRPDEATTIQFNVTIQGSIDTNKQVFVELDSGKNDMSYKLKCTNTSGNEWSVQIPRLYQLYDKRIDSIDYKLIVVAGDYYFEPVKDKIAVLHEVTASVITSMIPTKVEDDEDEDDTDVSEDVPVIQRESPATEKLLGRGIFKRDPSGKIIIPGLKDPGQEMQKKERARRVQTILGSLDAKD